MNESVLLNVSSSQLPHRLPPSLHRLIHSIQNQSTLTPEIARQCIIEANIHRDDLLPWADFDHPIADSYGRKLVYDGGYFEVMVMSWAPGDFSAIHDHGGTQWGAVQCFGAAEHFVYTFEDNLLRTKAKNNYFPGSVKTVDRHLIHQMGNPGNSCFLSLHLYGCDTSVGPHNGKCPGV